jgi:predicted ATPase
LKDELAREPHRWLECHSSPYFQHSAWYPIIDLLQRTLGYRREDTAEARWSKLERDIERYGLADEVLPLWAALLGMPLSERHTPLPLSPQRQRQKTLETLVAWLQAMAREQPVLFVVEDLHWVDPSTLEFLHLLLASPCEGRLLVLLSFRPEFDSTRLGPVEGHRMSLSRLDRPEVEQLILYVAGGKRLPRPVLRELVLKSDSIPLFVEEITKTALESGLLIEREGVYELEASLSDLAIPTTLYDSLMARLDRLSTVKEVAQLAATLGREFSYELIQAISPLEEQTLRRELGRLVEAAILQGQGVPPQASYTFKHVLLQETAYQSLLKSRRVQLHQQIAQVLETQFPEIAETQPELLAHHYTEAGMKEPAMVYWQKAGLQAAHRSANVEALSYLTRALNLLRALPETAERDAQELELQLALGRLFMMMKGYTAPEAAQAYTRAYELCEQVVHAPQRFIVLQGLWLYYLMRSEFRTALEVAQELLKIAEARQEARLLPEATDLIGHTHFFRGEFTAARTYLERAAALYHGIEYAPTNLALVHHPAIRPLHLLAWTLWFLGCPDQALQKASEALRRARELNRPFGIATGLVSVGFLHQLRGEPERCEVLAREAIQFSSEQEFPFWLALATVLQGWSWAQQGQVMAGRDQILEGLAIYARTGARLTTTWELCLIAEAQGACGQVEEGLDSLREAARVARETGEHCYEAEVYRLQGELLIARSPDNAAEAEACLRTALETARQQQAKALELRALTSLMALLCRQGRAEEVRQALAKTYSEFTEGHETADLRRAKAALAVAS